MTAHVPWGFVATPPHGHLVAKTTVADRRRRAELGETALKLLTAMDISLELVEKLNELPPETEPAIMVAELLKLKAELGVSNA